MFGQFDEIYWLSNYPVRRGWISKRCIMSRWGIMIYWLIYMIFLPAYLHGWTAMWEIWWVWNLVNGTSYVWFFAVNHWTMEAEMVDYMNITKNNWGKL